MSKVPQSFRRLLPIVRVAEAERARRHFILYPGPGLVQRHLSDHSSFCNACIAMGYLSQAQMQQAVSRYRLGMTRDGGVIFWQIDQLGQLYDGKVMYYRPDCHRDHSHLPTWVNSEIRRFYLDPDDPLNLVLLQSTHTLFGLHLLRQASADKTVAVVEAEKTAVILSAHFPQYLWLATGGLNELSPEKLFALHRHPVVLFPDTDPQCQTFTLWYNMAARAQAQYGCRITVSPLLEQHASPSQKERKIDLVDFLFEASDAPFQRNKQPV